MFIKENLLSAILWPAPAPIILLSIYQHNPCFRACCLTNNHQANFTILVNSHFTAAFVKWRSHVSCSKKQYFLSLCQEQKTILGAHKIPWTDGWYVEATVGNVHQPQDWPQAGVPSPHFLKSAQAPSGQACAGFRFISPQAHTPQAPTWSEQSDSSSFFQHLLLVYRVPDAGEELWLQIWWDDKMQTFFSFFHNFLNWSIVDVQCCVSFSCTAQWFSYIYTFFFRFFSLIGYCKILSIVPCAIQ